MDQRRVGSFLVAGSVLLFAGHSFERLRHGRVCDLGQDNLIFATVFQFFFLRLAVFFGCVGVFMNLFRGEMLEKSLHYYLLTPVRREVLLAGKYLSGVVTTVVIFGTSAALSLAGLYWHIHPQVVRQYLLEGGGLEHVAAYLGITALACIGYGGVFLLMSFLFNNPMIPAAIVLVWEGLNPFLPAALKKISVIFYLQSLCQRGQLLAALRAVVNASALTSTPGASREAAYWSAASEISSAPSAAFVSDATCCFVCKLPPPPPVAAGPRAWHPGRSEPAASSCLHSTCAAGDPQN